MVDISNVPFSLRRLSREVGATVSPVNFAILVFFRPYQGGQSHAQLDRFHFPLLRLLPELSQLKLEVGPRGLILLGTCFVCQRALRQVLPDHSAAAAWFRHLLHSARSSRYFSRSLLRLFNKDRTRIRCRDFASIGALQDPLRSNRIGFHAQDPSLRDPILTKQKPHFAQTTNAMSRSTRNPPGRALARRLYKTNFSPDLDGRAVEKRKKPVPEGPAHADDAFTASRCGLSGTGS